MVLRLSVWSCTILLKDEVAIWMSFSYTSSTSNSKYAVAGLCSMTFRTGRSSRFLTILPIDLCDIHVSNAVVNGNAAGQAKNCVVLLLKHDQTGFFCLTLYNTWSVAYHRERSIPDLHCLLNF